MAELAISALSSVAGGLTGGNSNSGGSEGEKGELKAAKSKVEAELVHTKTEFQRVQTELFHAQRNVDSLTEKCRGFEEKCKDIQHELTTIKHQNVEKSNENSDLKRRLEASETKRHVLDKENASLQQNVEHLNHKLQEKDREIVTFKNDLDKAQQKLTKYDRLDNVVPNVTQNAIDKINSLNQCKNELTTRIVGCEAKLSASEETVQRLQQDLSRLESEKLKQFHELVNVRESFRASEMKTQDLVYRLQTSEQVKKELEEKLTEMQTDREEAYEKTQQVIQNLKKSAEEIQSERNQCKTQLNDKERELIVTRNHLDAARTENGQLANNLKTTEAEFSNVRTQLINVFEKCALETSRRKTVETNWVEANRNWQQSEKALEEERDKYENVKQQLDGLMRQFEQSQENERKRTTEDAKFIGKETRKNEMASVEIGRLNDELEKAKRELMETMKENHQLEQKVEKIEECLQELRRCNVGQFFNDNREQLEMKLKEISDKLDRTIDDIRVNKTSLNELQECEMDNFNVVQRLEMEFTETEQEIDKLKREKRSQEDTITRCKVLQREDGEAIFNAEREIQQRQNRIRKNRSFLDELEPNNHYTERDLADHLTKTLEANECELRALENKKVQHEISFKKSETMVRDSQTNVEGLEKVIETKLRQMNELKENRKRAKDEVAVTKDKIVQAKQSEGFNERKREHWLQIKDEIDTDCKRVAIIENAVTKLFRYNKDDYDV